MKKIFLSLLVALLPLVASADTSIIINGIRYNLIIKLKTAEVIELNYYDYSYSGYIVIPETVEYDGNTYSVTSIGEEAFKGSNITGILIGENVTTIGNYAFYNCSLLTSVIIGNSVTSIGSYAFYNCSRLTSVIIPNSVTSIGSSAFSKCSGLTSVTIGNSVTSIGSSAFNDCSGLTSVIIPNSVTSIGSYAFYNCSGLTSVTIGNSVTSIGSSAFYYCSRLTSVTIPNSVTSIGSSAFYNCSRLTSVIIGNSVTSIGEKAFNNCSRLTSVTIPNSVTSIGEDAFNNCSGLTSVHISDIGAWCKIEFRNGTGVCHSNPLYYAKHLYMNGKEISDLVIPNNVVSIGNYAFYNCSGLTSVTIPNSVTSIGEKAFSSCKELLNVYCLAEKAPSSASNAFSGSEINYATLHVPATYMEMYKTVEPWKNFGSIVALKDGDIPSTDDETPNEEVNDLIGGIHYKFADNFTAEVIPLEGSYYEGTITIPNSVEYNGKTYIVTSIGEKAFYWSGLQAITIPNSVVNIGKQAFYLCSKLTSITIPNSVTNIEESAFEKCRKISSITIPKSVTSIGLDAFKSCDELTNIIVDTENKVYDSRNNCNAIIETASNKLVVGCKATVIPNSVVNIGEKAFNYCSKLTSITIPNSVSTIESYAFYSCDSLKSITIGSGVTNIEGSAFKFCRKISSITIPKSVTSIGLDAFSSCDELTNIIVDTENKVYDSRNNCNAIIETASNKLVVGCKATIIPNSVVNIGKDAFYYCSKLTSITIPNSVSTIESYAFNRCDSLKSITIGSGVTNIASLAFYSNPNLSDVYCLAVNVPTTSTSAFYTENVNHATLHVPVSSIEEYKATKPWNYFGNIVPLQNIDEPSDGEKPEEELHNNHFVINDIETRAGQSVMFPVEMNNEVEVVAFQCDVYLPEGVTLQTKNGKYDITLDENRKDDHSVTSALQADGSVRIIVASLTNSIFSETSGTLFNLNLLGGENISGNLAISIKNIHISVADGTMYDLEDVTATIAIPSYTPADVNDDGVIAINDVVLTINALLGTYADNFVFAAADMNGDNQIMIGDVVQVINSVLGLNTTNELTTRNIVRETLDIIETQNGFGMSLSNAGGYVAMQYDMNLPAGVSINDISVTAESNHSVSFSEVGNGQVRVAVVSLTNDALASNGLLEVSVCAESTTSISITNAYVATRNGIMVEVADADAQLTRGGTNSIQAMDTDVAPADIFELSGRIVKKAATSLEGLDKGVYLMNGKKVVVK